MRRRRFPQRRKNEKRINEAITAREVFVISDSGESLWKMSRNEALNLAENQELDLVEIGMQDKIPLTKIIDYGKFLFKQQKQQSNSKNNAKKTEIKTMKITYKIGEHDLAVKRKQAQKWSKEGNPIKIFLQLRGRENQYEDLAVEKINEFIMSLEEFYKKDEKSRVAKHWNTFNIILYPKK